jgi:hypothetical protein
MYCNEHGLIYSRFNYWCQKFALAKTKEPVHNSGFAAITLTPAKMQSPALCTLELGDAKQLQIHDINALKAVIEFLG